MSFGLGASDIQGIRDVFTRFAQVQSVVLYGSRAKGTYKPGSDIDLTIKGEGLKLEDQHAISYALDELDLPYTFDLSIFDHLENPDFLNHIERVGVTIYKAKKEEAAGPAQSEAQLEKDLIKRLTGLGYERVTITDGDELITNLKRQLEKHNEVKLSDGEFEKVLNHLDKGNVFARARTLRGKFHITRDDGTTPLYLELLNTAEWCLNEYQVAHQISQEGSYKNRYDVTLLINGLPLVQIELKRRGLELKEAFNQINRYQRHSFWSTRGLFNFVQIFVISNGVNTRYFANNRDQSFKQTFYWSDVDNDPIRQLDAFADVFLEPCHVSKMICRYTVQHETDKILMVMRPYQYYAVEAIVQQVKNSCKNGYIWHTTGSGKTLTSFKAAQIITALPKVHKVVFVVDRADLDYQTTNEFNAFRKDCVDGTSNTKSLVAQFSDETPLIVTTIQKLNNAIRSNRHETAMAALVDKRMVFIFDECHRSQFGETHKRIKNFFNNVQMFGFTGTPIFEANAIRNEHGKRTTKELFGTRLHTYVLPNAIKDENVLKFAVEYWGKLRRRDGSLIDEKVISIDTKEFFENPDRIENVADWVIKNHGRKTHNKDFTAIMCVGSIDALITYYEAFKAKKLAGEHNLRVVTVFTYGVNENDGDADGLIAEPNFNIEKDASQNKHSREKLDEYIADYNAQYGTGHSTRDSNAFYNYYRDIAKRIKARDRKGFDDKDRIDILLVVNMYLTGFDAKKVNTLYVDKNLRHHGLIQAFSRTNRILNEVKSQGNIVCFRNLKDNTDEAVTLFSNKDASETILIDPYEDYVGRFNDGVKRLLAIAPTVDSVDDLKDEEEELKFIQAFRFLMRQLNVLKSFVEFSWSDLHMTGQMFEDYKSKYLDLHDKTRTADAEEKASVLEDIDFELELIQRDEINVAYILKLLSDLHRAEQSDNENERRKAAGKRESILNMLGSEPQLRSKRELIEKFINDQMPTMKKGDNVEAVFKAFWSEQQTRAMTELCETEGLDLGKVQGVIDGFRFSGQQPLREDIISALNEKPKLLQRRKIVDRVRKKILNLIHTFDDKTGDM